VAWIFGRLTGETKAEETAIGLVPPIGEGGINTDDLDVSAETMAKLLEVDHDGWAQQLPQMKEHLATFGDKLPSELAEQLRALEKRLDV
jgi:phosphoenolpyruvate carboxykinase (GTP)